MRPWQRLKQVVHSNPRAFAQAVLAAPVPAHMSPPPQGRLTLTVASTLHPLPALPGLCP